MSPVDRTGSRPRRIVVVHDRVDPALTAGDYEVRVAQAVSGDPDLGTVADDVRHVRVTAPRYRLASTDVLSSFPPPNAAGPFTTRLAQVALRRRTLPWERADGPTRPWLALVLLSDGEGELLASVPVEQAVTAGVRPAGTNPDGPTCAAIEISERVVAQVFPSRQDLPYTCHVRQVPVGDTELAQGDDDGWIAVVIASRLPRPGLRYRACLVSLEGQWHELPDNPPTETRVTKAVVYDDITVEQLVLARRPSVDGVSLTAVPSGKTSLAAKRPAEPLDRETADGAPAQASGGHTAPDAWGNAGTGTAGTPVLAQGGPVVLPSVVTATAVGTGAGSVVLDVSVAAIEPAARLLRFPVLTSWEFRCEGDKDFAALVQGLDVGLLGTAARPGRGPTDRVPEVAETGHVVLAGLDRGGEPMSTWYRGPLVPRAVERRAPEAVHVSDQLRRLAEDGRTEIGEAAAFELGRLLALSSPSTVAALREWRRRGFAVRRAAALGEVSVLGDLLSTWGVLDAGELRVERFAELLGRQVLTTFGAPDAVETVLPRRPDVDPLPQLDLLRDPVATIAEGLAVPIDALRVAAGTQVRPQLDLGMLTPIEQLGFTALSTQPELLAPLAAGLTTQVADLTRLAGRGLPGVPGGPGVPGVPGGPVLHPHGGARTAGVAAEPASPARDAGPQDELDTVEGLFPGAAPLAEEDTP